MQRIPPLGPNIFGPRWRRRRVPASLGLLVHAAFAYDFESGALTDDASANGNDLTNVNVVTSVSGKVGNAANFVAASSQELTCAFDASMAFAGKDWSLFGWFYATASGVKTYVGVGDPDLLLWSNGSAIQIRAYKLGTGYQTAQVTFTGGQWNFVCARWNETAQELSISLNNGAAVTTSVGATLYTSDQNLSLGNGAAGYLDGMLDSLAWLISDPGAGACISDAEMAAIYNGGSGIASSGLA